jgi:RHS repeat-associated protein
MRYFLLFLALFLQLNASGYTDYNPQKNCAQQTLTAESSGNNERSFVLFRYQGQYEDNGTGLYYNRFRYYSPEEGMYLSQDSIGLAGGNPTLYGYVEDPNSLGHTKATSGHGAEPHFNIRPIINTQTGHVEGTHGHYNF